ncbi:type II toxin-antitoxin system PemK/MazF family toxin [Bombilactobacillus folatiphilus]|uniref:Type II toxin-antitoxin system PemK/MazF family toxin n=1 Tax=Bombilactobacillus folatiphilus TaxID=2923362 RepID=A0ABY4PB68_9LACO|nr:type II toxin-antitoxin system PemK/MazF family toxin [Bombilactobacillus folatiphilus]UQS82822.1 type II toxin-antitoxin system PemK/MazF family toxin [Bombilactobacillus folatiphilus]
MEKYQPHQGDIVKVHFDPSLGHEQKGYRPALIISQDIMSLTSPFIWIVPISHGNYDHPLHIKLDKGTITDGTIFVEQLKSIDFLKRKVIYIEKVPNNILMEVLNNIKETL